uniref:J domain-containing protein n=1 Tax=Timema poppense TaxID=170557 RepID=A0A7R9DEZ1_TIMPO|nr:unnamed protein product [Timema poppensis]
MCNFCTRLRTEISCTGRSVIRHSHLHRENPRSTVPNTFRRFKFDGNPLQCWNCRSRDAAKQLFCSRCKVLQRPEHSSTYFDIIGVAQTYNVSLSELTSRYRKLQSSLHPDRFSNSSEVYQSSVLVSQEEKRISEDYSALVNAAYSTLLHPMKRGLYMLQLRGVSLEEGEIQTSPLLLIEVMERNEELAEARDEASVKRIAVNNKQRLDQLASCKYSLEEAGESRFQCFSQQIYQHEDTRRINSEETLLAFNLFILLTHWGTWLHAALYYADYLGDIQKVVQIFYEEQAVAITEANAAISCSRVSEDLAYVKSTFGNLPGAITALEARDLPLVKAVKIMRGIEENLNQASGSF